MAITTLDQLIAGFDPVGYWVGGGVSSGPQNGRFCSGWLSPYDTTLDGVQVSQSGGLLASAFPFYDPTPSPDSQQVYIGKLTHSTTLGIMYICDRLWHNGGYTITSTGAQSSTTPSWPPRDHNGSSDGVGVLLGLEVSATTGAGTPTITCSYTNSDGTAGRSGTNVWATFGTCPFGMFFPISLQAGDIGVRSLQSMTLSASWTSGTVNMVAYRVLASIVGNTSGLPMTQDFISGFAKLYPGTTPFVTGAVGYTGGFGGAGMIHYARG